ncbi:MAG TPA: imidazole glycerol phosphate synthase subunit HisH [Bacteroidota bacterium]|nr:imidazole glycerol phosphate synthase subunit HisH [Bacteroidota bacterium]
MIGIVDYEAGNISSVVNALKALDLAYRTTSKTVELSQCSGIILPGVGAAPGAMHSLQNNGLVEFLRSFDRPLLGICLGMQLLFERSEEGDTSCLGIIPGCITKLGDEAEKIPHMGWNAVDLSNENPLMKDIPTDSYFYFAHSYVAPVRETTVATCRCGSEFAAIVRKGNFLGVQFHPEKSGRIGLKLLKNFSDAC